MGKIYNVQNPFKWLGAQATAQGVVPASAGKTLLSPTVIKNLLDYIELKNRNAGTLNCALVGLLKDADWHFGQLAADGTYSDATANAQSGTVDVLKLEEKTGAAGSGFVVSSRVTWGAMSVNISTAGVGASQEHTWKYWNGSTWATLTPVLIAGPTAAGELWASGENVVLFDPPSDWAVGGTDSGGAIAAIAAEYAVQCVMTVDGTTNALARRVYLGEVLASMKTVAAAPGSFNPAMSELEIPSYIQAVQGVFSVITIPNTVSLGLQYRNAGRAQV